MTGFAIDIHGLCKVFANHMVVDHLSLQVKQGSVFGFLGSNGSGKTTTIRMICGLLTPSEGSGHCLGYDILREQDAIKKKIGYMPQRFSLYNGLSVYENLRFIADIYQINNTKAAIANIINDLELEPYQHIKAEHLSGGWKQRLTLACCLIHRPELLFLDEPTAGIDPKARKDFWDYLHKIALRDGTTVLVTTHYMDEAEKCTDLAYINLGKLLYSGSTRDLSSFSQVKTYRLQAERESLESLRGQLMEKYPRLLISVVNNDLRISSRDHPALAKFIQQEKAFQLTEVAPSFEEVFIGLMQ